MTNSLPVSYWLNRSVAKHINPVVLSDGTRGKAAVPSGVSIGSHEAVELRDGDASCYPGKGVLSAVQNINQKIGPAIAGLEAFDQRAIDDMLVELDGNWKSGSASNAMLAVSLACARAAAQAQGLALYQYLGDVSSRVLPVPLFTMIEGGKCGKWGSDFQELQVVPLGAETYREAYRYGAEAYQALGALLAEAGMSTSVGSGGGFVPRLKSNTTAMDLIMFAIERAGFRPGEDIAIGLDAAASSLFDGRAYQFTCEGIALSTQELIRCWRQWIEVYPVASLEDPLDQNDWPGFAAITGELGGKAQIVGGNLFVTNAESVRRGVEEGCCNSIAIKLSQAGTVTEAIDTAQTALGGGFACLVSHDAPETPDTSIADLAVALNCGQIKAGAPARAEHVAKYNRLLEIESMLGEDGIFAGRAAFPSVIKRESPDLTIQKAGARSRATLQHMGTKPELEES